MKKNIIFIMLLFALLVSSNTFAEDPVPPPQIFIEIVNKVEEFLLSQNIQLKEGENIKDVASFAYLNAIKRRDKGFGYLDDKIKEEAKSWAAIWCWIPGIPEQKKKKAEESLKKVRKALIKGAYERTLASLTIIPNFAFTCLGEVAQYKQIFSVYPAFGNSRMALEKTIGYPPSSSWAADISQKKLDYRDIINSDWVSRYLK